LNGLSILESAEWFAHIGELGVVCLY